jgi:hypothetical protein
VDQSGGGESWAIHPAYRILQYQTAVTEANLYLAINLEPSVHLTVVGEENEGPSLQKLETLRAVITHDQRGFGQALSKVLSPAQPLQSEEYLKGRAEQLYGIEKALYAPGRHVLIHGLRGVGKSSLAQTAAYKISQSCDPIIVSCDPQSTFRSIIKDIFDEVLGKDPRVAEEMRVKEVGVGISFWHFSGTSRVRTRSGLIART